MDLEFKSDLDNRVRVKKKFLDAHSESFYADDSSRHKLLQKKINYSVHNLHSEGDHDTVEFK